MDKLSLKHVRSELGLSQKALHKLAKIGVATIVEAEGGSTISLISAYALLRALNAKRKEFGLSELGINDLDWSLPE